MQFGFLSNMRKVSADSHWLTAAAVKMQRRFSGCCLQTVSSASLYSTYWPIGPFPILLSSAQMRTRNMEKNDLTQMTEYVKIILISGNYPKLTIFPYTSRRK